MNVENSLFSKMAHTLVLFAGAVSHATNTQPHCWSRNAPLSWALSNVGWDGARAHRVPCLGKPSLTSRWNISLSRVRLHEPYQGLGGIL